MYIRRNRHAKLAGIFALALLFPVAFVSAQGLPDRFIREDSQVTRLERDLAARGFVDYILWFDEKGRKIREQMDTNGDGLMDTFYYYSNGALDRVEIDSNFDGRIDIWVWLQDALYVKRYERDTDFDGKVDIVKDFTPKNAGAPGTAATAPAALANPSAVPQP